MVGVDIVAISRIAAFYEKHGENALKRYLHPQEIQLAKSNATRAGFWAAKEAISKALGCGIGQMCGFHDITLYKDQKGAPHFTLATHLLEHFNITDHSLSIAHDGGFAIAVVSIQSNSPTAHKVQ
ncbi:holo-ACP synthase [Sulfurospirillum sp. T05]|uniref:Holo-[acyl-carrier-protein] synthase n=1 Tax=Sulfurospirillum tamanense TaxID=2813362 RepID=A0ABS2WUK1_9BACT|nr:holo-ACP synthase [Sulfurospirillum tamanensis]MBN2965326.1 holo-ACP synthase [Sulfurospirillum tamanensis]